MAKLVTLQDINSNETIYPVTISSAVFNVEGESLDSIVSDLEENMIQDAPQDGKSYARRNGDWSEISTTGGEADSVQWDNVLNKPTIPDGTYVLAKDIRSTNYSPFEQRVSTSSNAGLYDITIKSNNSDNWATQISGASTDGYHGTANLRYYVDKSGGAEYQLGFGNDIIAYRTGTSSWGNWTVLAKQSDINTINNKLNGIATGATKVEFTRNVTSGTKIGTITINDIDTDIYAPTSGAGNTGSDMRFKKNISEVDNILDKALGIDVISYIWNKEGETEKDTFGVNASQLEELGGVFKKIVHERNDETKTKWVEYDRIGVLALKALQEYKVKMDKVVEDLQNQIEELKKK